MLRFSESAIDRLRQPAIRAFDSASDAQRAGRAGMAWRPSWTAVAVALIALPPVGVVMLWLSNESTWQEKFTLTGITFGLVGAYAIITNAIVHL